MFRLRPWALACLALVQARGLTGCDDRNSGVLGIQEGGADANAVAANGGTPSGGGSAGSGAGGTGPSGSGGEPQADSGRGGLGGNTGSGGAGGPDAGSGGTGSNALSLCVRLNQPTVLSYNLARDYDRKVYGDCRVSLITDPTVHGGSGPRAAFLNQLVVWNMQLWGCTPPPPTDFALIYAPAPLTSADATALIDHYIDAASAALAMSQPEIAEMRAALERLSESVIQRQSDEFSSSRCFPDGGAGGSGGAAGSGGAGGAGGAAGSGGTAGTASDASADATGPGDADASGIQDAGSADGDR